MVADGTVNRGFEADDKKEVEEGTITRRNHQKLPYPSLSATECLTEKRGVRKNLVLVCCSILLVSSPTFALLNSTTSLIPGDGLGSTALAVSGTLQLLGAAFFVTYVTKVFGIRKMMSISLILPVFYASSFFYPTWASTLVTGGMLGFALSLLVSCTFMYGNGLGFWYAHVTQGNLDTTLALMSGLVNGCLGGGFVFGNVLLFVILNPGAQIVVNSNITEDTFDMCGKNYCNEDLSGLATMQPPVPWRYYTLFGIFSAMIIGGALLSLTVRDYSDKLGYTRRKKSEFITMLKETFLLLKNPRGYLLVAITLFIGLEESFMMSEFTKAYISCTVGIPKVGLVMFADGVSQIIVSLSQWLLVKYFGRVTAVILSVTVFLICLATLLIWVPTPGQTELLLVLAVFWGAADSILVSVVFSMYALLFEENIEGSFSVGMFWWSSGFMLSFVWSQFLCIFIKIYILICVSTVGLVLYIALEIVIRRKRRV